MGKEWINWLADLEDEKDEWGMGGSIQLTIACVFL
jgi:hypothetical protein